MKTKIRVMVIDDAQEILDLFQSLLAEEGHEVLLTAFGPADLHEVRKTMPDLLILDFPIGDEGHGWQLVQKLKMTRETAMIPLIICSGAVRLLRDLEGWLGEKGIGTVLKPFDTDDLLLTVRRMLASTQRAGSGRARESHPARRDSPGDAA